MIFIYVISKVIMVGCIYLIVNKKNLLSGNLPFFYIGSKKDIEKINEYWGSSKYLTEDIDEYGIENFDKIILKEITYTDYTDVITEETEYHTKFDVVKSNIFYNKSWAGKDFYQVENKHTINSVWINNGKKNKRVKETELNEFLDTGFVKGRLGGKYMKNRIYINDGKLTKSVNSSELSLYKKNGWVVGRITGNQLGRRAMNKDGITKKILNLDVTEYLSSGWKFGQSKK